MPIQLLAIMLCFAIAAGGATAWALMSGGIAALTPALPAFLIAAWLLRRFSK